jgi:hypothetical protein
MLVEEKTIRMRKTEIKKKKKIFYIYILIFATAFME